MKVLIWIATMLVVTIVNELIGMALGIKLGYLLVFALIYFIANSLCKSLEQKRLEKQEDAFYNAVKNSGLSKFEYVLTHVPTNVMEACERMSGDLSALETYLEQLKNSNVINARDAEILLRGYREKHS